MSKTWVFIGGMVAGIAGVFAAAFGAEELEDKGKTPLVGNDKLAFAGSDGMVPPEQSG